MKKLFSMIAILAMCASVYAQDVEFRPKGYAGFIEEGLAGCTATGDLLHSSTATVHGYQFNSHWFLGAGLAIDIDIPIKGGGDPVSALPIFADVRYDLTKKKISPFVDLRAGYSPISDSRRGAYVSPTIGVDFGFQNHPKMALYCGVMYEFQQCTFDILPNTNLHYVGAKFGFRF